jgi:hypothetical protein
VDVALGDSVTVDLAEHDINRSLRIVKRREVIEAASTIFATLTNRVPERGGDRKRRDDLERFNSGYQGFVDRDNVNSGWNPAGDGTPQTLVIPAWPSDIVREDRVELFVQGRAWRSPVTATGHTHDVTVTHPSHDHDIPSLTVNGSTATGSGTSTTGNTLATAGSGVTQLSDSDGVPNGSSTVNQGARVLLFSDTSCTRIRVQDTTEGDQIADLDPEGQSFNAPVYVTVPLDTLAKDRRGHTIEGTFFFASTVDASVDTAVQIETEHTHAVNATTTQSDTSDASLGTNETTTSDSTTDFSPQVIDTFGGNQFYPTDVEIKVDGTTVTTLAGDANNDWQETVDLAGELSPGQNTITAEPTSQRGAINLTLSSQLFRSG